MVWLYFLLAAVALAAAFVVTSVALLLLCLLAALGLTLVGVLKLFADRVASRSGDAALALDPDELRRWREQADARRGAVAHADDAPTDAAPPDNA